MPFQGSLLSRGVKCVKQPWPWKGEGWEGLGGRGVTPRILRAPDLPSLELDKPGQGKP